MIRLRFLAAASCALAAASFVMAAAPDQLRCEGLKDPLGIDRPAPRLSWAIPPGGRGLAQAARQILVADSPEALADGRGTLWDSGRVVSDVSQWTPYAGAPLAKGTACWWKVRVWNQDGEPSPWSAPANFTVGPLSAAEWRGDWIGADCDRCGHVWDVFGVRALAGGEADHDAAVRMTHAAGYTDVAQLLAGALNVRCPSCSSFVFRDAGLRTR